MVFIFFFIFYLILISLFVSIIIGAWSHFPFVMAGVFGIFVGAESWDLMHHLFAIVCGFLACFLSLVLYSLPILGELIILAVSIGFGLIAYNISNEIWPNDNIWGYFFFLVAAICTGAVNYNTRKEFLDNYQ